MPELPSAYELSVSCDIAAPPAHVWQVMTQRMAEWWCPEPWTTEIVAMEQRAGGRSATIMRGPNGEESGHEGLFLAWDEGRRFAFTDAVTADLMPQGPFMIGIMELTPQGTGTRYTATARHWTAEAMEQHRSMGFEQGWNAVAAQLKALCERG